MDQYNNYINSVWRQSRSQRTFNNISPANKNDIIGEFPESNAADLEEAVTASKFAFDKWKRMPAPKRGDILRIAGDIFAKRKNELAQIMTREMGKPVFETKGDIQEAIDTCYYAATETRRLFGHNAPSEMPDKMNLSFRVPVGICGIITAWNFPIAVPSWKIIPALAAGNVVIFKPSEDSPLSANIFAEIMEQAGLPKGVFNVLHGAAEIGDAIVNHPGINLIGFTGSTETGKKIAATCGKLNKKVSLEMGGKNAQIVMDDANLELAIEGALWGAYGTTGQRCTATSRVLLHSAIHDKFLDTFKEKVKNLKLGDGLNPKTDVGPVINQKAIDKILGYIEIGKSEGAKLEFGGSRADNSYNHSDDNFDLSNGNFIQPTLFSGVTKDMRIFQEEIFGPVLSVSKFDTLEEAINLSNSVNYGLSSSIYTNNVRNSWVAVRELEAGITYVNAPTIGAEAHMPFGGVKGTGNGHREGGWTVFDIFTEWKTVYIDYSDKLQRAQIDNYDE
jgi:aldehyde dehydrogenase (NAD+)